MIHELKCWPAPFEATYNGSKRFELRRDDRGFSVDDVLFLREFDPDSGTFTGRSCRCRVLYILREGYGLPGSHVVMSLSVIEIRDRQEASVLDLAARDPQKAPR